MGYEAILEAAEAFQQIATSLVASIGRECPEGSSLVPPTGYGNLVCCATNIGFALELYLKALSFQLDGTLRQGHELSKLFGDLPQDIRFEIELDYIDRVQALPKESRFSITLAKGPPKSPEWEKADGEQLLLESLLERSKNLFVTWRYIFEFTSDTGSEYQTHRFDYLPLQCACQAIRANIMNRGGSMTCPTTRHVREPRMVKAGASTCPTRLVHGSAVGSEHRAQAR